MNTQEKIDKAANSAILCLHKEGIFYKLYNQHAMLFTQNIKALKVTVKFIKAVDQHVYSGGFPASIIEDIKKQLTAHDGVIEESEKLLTVSNMNWEKENDYPQWCKQQKRETAAAEKNITPNSIDLEKEWRIGVGPQ